LFFHLLGYQSVSHSISSHICLVVYTFIA